MEAAPLENPVRAGRYSPSNTEFCYGAIKMEIGKWEFALSVNCDERKALETPPLFEYIVEEIRNGMNVLCCHQDPCKENKKFARVAYCIAVSRKIFDLFFNSRNGYRAQYYISPYHGLYANEKFMQVLISALVSANRDSTLSPDFSRESLQSPSSKVWLAEVGKEVRLDCHTCKGEWRSGDSHTAEIINDRWERCASPRWGSRAPYLTKLRILGAFVDDLHNVFIPAQKRYRATDIHECGWS